MKNLILIITLACFYVNTAYAQNKNLSFQFNHNVSGQPLELNKTIFSIHNGKKVKITRAEFYLSGVTLISESQDSFKIEDSYILANANKPAKQHEVGLFPENFIFNKISMDVGIDKIKNHEDPTLYPPTHPLGPKSPDMHWGWAAGYRFIALEGLVDNNNDGVPEQDFQFHSLGDDLLFTALLDLSGIPNIDTEPFIIDLDYTKLFQAIQMTGNLFHHGSSALNRSLLLNAAKNDFMSPGIVSSTIDHDLSYIAKITQNNREIAIQFHESTSKRLVSIINSAGQKLRESEVIHSYHQETLTEFMPGQYFMIVREADKLFQKKIFIY